MKPIVINHRVDICDYIPRQYKPTVSDFYVQS